MRNSKTQNQNCFLTPKLETNENYINHTKDFDAPVLEYLSENKYSLQIYLSVGINLTFLKHLPKKLDGFARRCSCETF